MEEQFKHGLLWQDHQHSQLLTCIESLNKTRSTKLELTELENAIRFLEFYVKTHFEMETYYMQELNYPDTFNHQKAHEQFVRMLTSFKAKVETITDSSTIITELCNWVMDHILKTDKKLADFIKHQAGKGLQL